MATTTVFLPSGTSDLVVEAFSTPDPSYLLGVAGPDAFGRVQIDLPEALLSSLFGEDRPEVFFRVWSGATLHADTENTVRWNTRHSDTTFRLELRSLRLPGKPSPHVVRGRVHASGLKQGWSIEVFDKPLRGELRPLASCPLDEQGAYELSYSRADLRPAGRVLADLVLIVRDANGKERFRSQVLHRTPPTLILDPVLDEAAARGPSVFDRITGMVRPWLGELAPADLEDEEGTQLARSIGLPAEALLNWIASHRMARELLHDEPPLAISPEVAFALWASGIHTPAAVRTLRSSDIRTSLETAAQTNLVQLAERDITTTVKALRAGFSRGRSTQPGRRAPTEPRTGSDLAAVLSLGLEASKASAFCQQWFAHEGDTASFWEKLPSVKGFEESATVERAQLLLQLDTLTLGNLAVTKKLLADGVNAVADLVRYDVDGWQKLLTGSGVKEVQSTARAMAASLEIAFPHAYVAARIAEAPREQEKALVKLLAKHPELDLATTSVRAFTAKNALSSEAAAALAQTTRVFRLVRGPDRLGRMRTLVNRGLDSAPRIARMGKRAFLHHHAEALGGQASALRIWRRAAGATMVAHTATMRYRRDLNSLQPWAAGGGALQALSKFEVVDTTSQLDMPSWAELFGSDDACACAHCRSVLSPAAYLTDLLHFLVYPPTGGDHPGWYDKLCKRRPDIPLIHLNCANTDTVLPYIDLVNEVLENAVVGRDAERETTGSAEDLALPPPARQEGSCHGLSRQTTWRAEDLALHPEHLNDDAYATLAAEGLRHPDDDAYATLAAAGGLRHPWTLPFDLADEEIRAYLPLTATTRAALMETLGMGDPVANPSDAERQEAARELIGFTPGALKIVTQPAGSDDWALADTDAVWTTPSTKSEPTSVRAWMRRAQLDYQAFDQVLRCRSVNPATADGFRVRIRLAEGNCDLSSASLTFSNGAGDWHVASEIDPWIQGVLARIPRFERLRRALGWSAYDLDKALFALRGSLDADGAGYSASFTGIVEIHRLRTALKLPIEELVSLWGAIPTDTPDDEPSLYDCRFQDPGRGPVVVAFSLAATRTELEDTSAMLSTLRPSTGGEHVAVALGAMGLKAEDLERLLDHLFPADSTAPLNLANLSRLYGAATLARALKLKVADFVALLELTGLDPFSGPLLTRELVDEAAAARKAPLSLATVDALLRRQLPAIEHDPLGSVLRTLRARLQETTAELVPIADADGGLLSEVLQQVLPETFEPPHEVWSRDTLVPALVAFAGLSGLEPDTLDNWGTDGTGADTDTANAVADWQAGFDEAWAALESNAELAAILARATVGARLRNPGWTPEAADLAAVEHPSGTTRYDVLQGALLQYRREHLTPARIAEALALALGLDGDITTELVETSIHAVTDAADGLDPDVPTAAPAIALFVHPAFATAEEPPWPEGDPDPIVDTFPAQARTLRRLFAVATLLSALSPSLDELPLLLGELRDVGWLDPDALPVEEVTNSSALQTSYAAWRRLRDGWAVRTAMGGSQGPFPGFLRAARDAAADAALPWVTDTLPKRLATLVDQLGWPEADLGFFVGVDAFNASAAGTWADERWWARLSAAMAVVQRTGLPARTLWRLARRPVDPDDRRALADELKQAVRARYDENSWPVVARPVRDALREKQRDALVAWLLANRFPAFDTADDLYRWFLIDVQMGACGETTRIREALSAVQLFMQQAMLGTVEDVEPSSSDREAWEWMSRYRVWEANRKVFLWPEHWMEPELRDDKSPFFEELEASILKDEVSEDNVERAYHEYLAKLDEVARLEVRGAVREVEPEGETDPDAMTVDRLHVVARTRAKPHKYFHRVREPGREGGIWGPWRPIDVEIEGDHLLPVVWDRRLYLFWPVFTAREKAPDSMNVPNQGDQNYRPNSSEPWLEVQIAWTRLHEGAWSPKGLSTQFATFNYLTVADADSFVLMDYRQKGAEPYLVLRTVTRTRHYSSRFPATWFRIRAEAGIFDLQETSELPRTDSYLTGVPDEAQRGRLSRHRRPDLSLAMSYLSGKGKGLALPAENTEWELNAKVLKAAPGPYSLTPLYPLVRPQRQATFPTLFYADDRRSFVIDPVERFFVEFHQKGAPTKPTLGLNKHLLSFEKPFIEDRRLDDILDDLKVAPKPFTLSPWEGIELPREGPVEAGTLVLGNYMPQGMIAQSRTTDSWTDHAPAAAVPLRQAASPARQITSPGLSSASDGSPSIVDDLRVTLTFQRSWRFRTNHHPWVRLFVKHLNAYGLNGLLDPRPDPDALDNEERKFLRRQGVHTDNKLGSWSFQGKENELGYDPTPLVVATDAEGNDTYPLDDIDFSDGGTYSLYNWELFFHAPLLVATHLSRNQRFEEARNWFHTIFDPTNTAEADDQTPQRFWKVKPLYEPYWAEDESAQGIDRLLSLFSPETAPAAKSAIYEDVAAQIRDWLDNPFSPWAIARLRWSAYQRTVVLRYVDNLIEWGDSYFRQYTLESVDQARLLYVLASELLGQRPEEVEIREPEPQSFQDLYNSGQLDLFSNALVEITAELDPTPSTAWDDLPPVLSPSLYYCIPRDEKLLAYWDRVEDRLYKIRHCLDIDGVARPLALFDPPIDPGGLVRAVAGGASIASALAALNAPIPAFRYSVMVARAKELCGEVRAFGAALLAALEKKDGEALARLRSTHELGLLDAVAEVRRLQIEEAGKAIGVAKASKKLAEARQSHFQGLLDGGWSGLEIAQMLSMVIAGRLRVEAGMTGALAGALALIPQFETGVSGVSATPRVSGQFGGEQLAAAVRVQADRLNTMATAADSVAATTGLAASHERRAQDWTFQRDLARKEIDSIDLQIEAAQLRLQIAEREQNNHALQRDNAAEADAFLRSKFTGVDLYDWMVGQLASVYVQAYQLALDLARRAERAWQFEVAAATPPTFVKASHWDSLRKGLLAGERLAMDLHRMEVAYLEQSRREYELSRRVSLAEVDPLALLTLKTTGACEFTLPEMLFDLDRPGLYHRRIKAVTLSVPGVSGPNTPLHATLRLLDSYVRTSAQIEDTTADSYGIPSPEDARFTWLPGPAQGVVTSIGVDDPGLFELNLRDERYLPFEGHGVVQSRWRIELPAEYRSFDYTTIPDAFLHLRYTAREGGDRLRDAATDAIAAWAATEIAAAEGQELQRVFSLPNWNALFQAGGAIALDLSKARFPYAFQQAPMITPVGGELWVFGADATAGTSAPAFTLSCNANEDGSTDCPAPQTITLTEGTDAPGVFSGGFSIEDAKTGTWQLAMSTPPAGIWATMDTAARLGSTLVRDACLVLRYRVGA